MLSASETDRTTVEARPRAEAEQLLEDNLQLKRHKLEEARTCDGVVKLIKRYDRDRHATLDELNAGLEGIISRRKKLRRESHIRDDWEAEVVALQAQRRCPPSESLTPSLKAEEERRLLEVYYQEQRDARALERMVAMDEERRQRKEAEAKIADEVAAKNKAARDAAAKKAKKKGKK